jgi:ABC-type transporter Mla maintaining outer membrane lipid asymmetry ATPase subunit MlaF
MDAQPASEEPVRAPSPAAAPLAIDARGLTKVFAGKPAVDQLTLRVARGRFFGFLGRTARARARPSRC